MIDIFSIILGCILGVFAGLVPGLGYFTTLMLVFPLLMNMTVLELLIVYSSVVTISIYIGSVPATLYGIPGDTSSMPTVQESKHLVTQTQVSQAISGAAFGGFFGSVSVAVLCFFMLNYLDNIKYFYSTLLFSILLTVTSIIIIYTASNKLLVSMILYITGFVLGSVGYNAQLNMPILVFNDHMYQGLPTEVVLATLFAVPSIAYYWNHLSTVGKKHQGTESFKIFKPYMLSPLKSVFITLSGFFTGMVPGLSTILSSTVGHNIMGYFTKDPVQRITASETANNAGAFSMLLPLLVFGIPITSSEALLLFFLEQNGFSTSAVALKPLFTGLVYNYLIINVVGLVLAWPLAKYVKYFYSIDMRYIFATVLIIILGTAIYNGLNSYSVWYYMTVLAVLLPVGLLLRNFNVLPLIFAFFISDIFISNIVVLQQLYF